MIRDYIKELKRVREEENLNVSDDIILEQAIKIHISELIGKQKLNNPFAKSDNPPEKKPVSPKVIIESQEGDTPTEKQIFALKKLEMSEEEIKKMSKSDAWNLIKNTKKENI